MSSGTKLSRYRNSSFLENACNAQIDHDNHDFRQIMRQFKNMSFLKKMANFWAICGIRARSSFNVAKLWKSWFRFFMHYLVDYKEVRFNVNQVGKPWICYCSTWLQDMLFLRWKANFWAPFHDLAMIIRDATYFWKSFLPNHFARFNCKNKIADTIDTTPQFPCSSLPYWTYRNISTKVNIQIQNFFL